MVAFVSGNGLGLDGNAVRIPGQQADAAALGQAGMRAVVNAHTGNLVLQRQDEILLGRGPDVAILRTYNSQGLLDDDNADNWRIGLYRSIGGLGGAINAAGSTLRRTDGDGAEQVYLWDAARMRYVSTGGQHTLTHDAAANGGLGAWTWTDSATGASETYDWTGASGKLLRVADSDGNGLTYAYAGNLLASVTSASGEQTLFDYSGTLLTQVRTVSSTGVSTVRTRYAYDAHARLAKVSTDLSPQDGSIADGRVFSSSYTYDDSNGRSNRVASITQSDGIDLHFTYQLVGESWRVATIRDALGRITSLAWDTVDGQSRITITDAQRQQTVTTTDSLGRLTSMQGPPVAGQAQVLAWTYNDAGDLQSQADARGNITLYDYDANGNPVRVHQQDAAGRAIGSIITRVFDADNRLLVETLSGARAHGMDAAVGGTPPASTRHAWDGRGHLRFSVSTEGRVTEYRYDALGQRVSRIDHAGTRYEVQALATDAAISESELASWVAKGIADHTRSMRTDTTYDFRGQVASVTTYVTLDVAGSGVVNGTQATTHYIHDAAGRLLSTVAPKGVATTTLSSDYVTTFAYDGLGRLTLSRDSLYRTTITAYDNANRGVITTMANGLVTTSAFNRAGELTGVLQSDGASATGITAYQYDAAGRLRMRSDPTGVRSWYLYDEAGRKVADIDHDGSLVETVHDAGGQVVRRVAYATALTATVLASLAGASGQPGSVTLASLRPAASASDRSTWQLYDHANRLARSIDEEGFVTSNVRDAAGRIIETIRHATALPATTIAAITADTAHDDPALSPPAHPDDRRTRHFYDADGLAIATLDAAGYLVESEYDSAARLVHTLRHAVQTDSALRSTGTLAQLRPGGHASDIHDWLYYDSRGKQVGSVDGEGFLTESVYDQHGNLTRQVRYANKALSIPLALMASVLPAALRPASNMFDQAITQTFSTENQLHSTTDYQGTVTRFSYDAAGNLVRTDKALGTSEVRTLQARYDRQGRLLGELSAEGSVQLASLSVPTSAQVDAIWVSYGLRHTVDAGGRRTSTTDANGLRTLFYFNADGQLTHTINPMGELVEQRTDVLGQVTHTIRYGYRITAATLATLTGGLVDARLLVAIDGIRDSEADSVEQVVFTRRGQVASTIDAMGGVRSNSYNAFGELASQQFPAIPVAAGSDSDPASGNEHGNDLRSEYRYDQRGSLVESRQAGGGSERFTVAAHDAFGRAILMVDGNGNQRIASHDRLGREVRTADSSNAVRSTTWDAFGRTLTQTDALGNITKTSYGTTGVGSTVVTTAEGISVTSRTNRHGQVISVTDGRFLTSRNTYDSNGNLVASTDAAGNALVNDYDRAGRLRQTTDARGVRTTFTYDAANRVLVRTLDPDGLNLSTRYAWDAKGQVLRMTDAHGVVTATRHDLKGRVVQVAVDPDGLNLRTIYTFDQHDQTLCVTEGAGTDAVRVTRFAYDRLGRRIAETFDPDGLALTTLTEWDRNDNVVSRTDANGNVTRHFYDAQNNLVYTLDPLGAVTHKLHDLNGHLIKTVAYARPLDGVPALAGTDDIAARLLAIASASDRVTTMARDRDGRIVHEINSLNQVTTNEFDRSGNIVRRIVRANTAPLPASPTAMSVTNAMLRYGSPADRVTRSIYDAANRAVFTIDAAGGVTQHDYDAAGHVVRSVAYAKPVSLAGNPSAAAVLAALAPNAARDQVTRTVYDAAGRAAFTIDSMGHVKETRYDGLGRIVRSIDHPLPVNLAGAPGLAAIRAALDANAALSDTASGVLPARTNTYDYDSAGRLIVSIDPAGHAETMTWDALGNKTSFINKNGAQWTYAYDAASRLVGETSPVVAVTTVSDSLLATTEQVALQTRLAWDALGNLVARTEAWGRAEERTTRYEYDALGRQVRTIHPQVTVYDAAADDLSKNGSGGIVRRTETSIAPTTTVGYDRFGNATVNRDAAGNISYRVYDRLGRIQYAIDAERSVTEYAYNVQGEQVRLTRHVEQISMAGHPDPAVPFTAAEIAALLSTSTGDRSILTDYDLAGRATRVTEPQVDAFDSGADAGSQYFNAGKTTRNTYDAFGRITQQSTLRNPLTDTWAHTFNWYDLRGNKVAQVDPMGYLSIWEHDAHGNITRHVEYARALDAGSWSAAGHAAPAPTTPGSSPDSAIGYDREWRYDYDLKGQKIRDRRINAEYAEHAEHAGSTGNTQQTRYSDLSTEYHYDALGNLTQRTDASGASTFSWYDVLGRIRAVANPTGSSLSGLTSLDNDAFGNVTRQTRHAQGASWEPGAGPAAPGGDNGDQVSLKRYDSHGRLVQEVDGEGGATHRSYDAMGHVAKQWKPVTDVYGSNRHTIKLYEYDRTGRQLATSEQSPGWPDKIVDRVSYNRFGEITRNGSFYFDYNAAGQLWRTNSEDGVDRVYLRDVQGAVTAEIRSQQRDLKYGSYSAADVALLDDDVMRTDTIVDLNERVVRQALPTFSIERNIAVAPAPVFPPAALSVSVSSDAGYAPYIDSLEWAGYNHVTLHWPSIAAWGGGNIYVQIDYTDPMTAWYDDYTWTRHITTKSIGREYDSQSATAGVQVSWHASETQGSIESVTGVTLYKRDASGNWLLLQQAYPQTAQMRYLAVPPMTALGGKVVVNLRAAGTTAWSAARLIDMGRQTLIDTSALNAALTYDFEILHYRRDDITGQFEPLHYASATGKFGVGGNGWVSSTPTPATTDSVRHAPVIEQTLDRWGNVIGVSRPGDASAITRYRYDGLNNVLQQTAMPVDVWGEDGIATRSTPVMRQYYDLLGRLLGDTDANGNTESRRYDAAGNVMAEAHADGGTVLHTHDLLGRKTSTTDAAGKTTRYTWDRMDRLTSEQRPIGTDYYEYDQAGNRIRESGARVAMKHWYDTRGRLVRTLDPLGAESSIRYDMHGNKTYESNSNRDWASWTYDAFGRVQSHTDFGGVVRTYSYNRAGQLIAQSDTGGQSLVQEYYANGALKRITDKTLNAETYYEIDTAGNRSRERFTKAGVIHLDNRITFDNAGRIITVQDNRYTLSYGYDANGNRRFNRAIYYDAAAVRQRIENWYQYDSMDRITLSQGVLVNGKIQTSATQGVALAYDAAGNRRSATSIVAGATVVETYHYDDNHRLITTWRNGKPDASRAYDGAGRVVEQTSAAGSASARRVVSTYNVIGQLTGQTSYDSANAKQSATQYTEYDRAGNLRRYQTTVYQNTQYTNTYTVTYTKAGTGYRESTVAGTSTYFTAGATTTSYDVNGNIVSVSDQFAGSKYRSFITDQAGHILKKTENGAVQYYFYVDGKPGGSTGAAGPSSSDFDFNYTPVSAQYPATTPGAWVVNSGDTLRSISQAVFGDARLWYLIADANGLRSDAELVAGKKLVIPNRITNLHNDSSIFKPYAPGSIIGDTTPTLPEPPPPPPPPQVSSGGGCGGLGQILTMVVVIVAAVYTAGAALSILAPAATLGTAAGAAAGTAISMAGSWASGMAMAVSGGIAGASMGALVLAGAIGGAMGSIVGQGLSMAMGRQRQFSWSAVAMGAVGGGVGASVGPAVSSAVGNGTTGMMAMAAATTAATQGIAIVTGLQDQFSWLAVAAAAVGAGVVASAGNAMGRSVGRALSAAGEGVADVAARTASGMMGSVARTMAMGGRLEFANVAADAFGNALGWSVADNIGRGSQQEQALGKAFALRPGDPNGTQVVNDVGNVDGDVVFGEPVRRTAVSDAVFDVLVDRIQDAKPVDGARIVLDDSGNALGAAGDASYGYRARKASAEDIAIYMQAEEAISGLNLRKIFLEHDPNHHVIGAYLDGTGKKRSDGGLSDITPAVSTNVGVLEWIPKSHSGNFRTTYISGVGTDWYTRHIAGLTGAGIAIRVDDAYQWISHQANTIYATNQNATFDFLGVGFSRGALTARLLLRAIDERGIPDHSSRYEIQTSDGQSEIHYARHIVAPGKSNLNAVLFDTVTTGVGDLYNIDLPIRAQVYHPIARDESRVPFPVAPLTRAGQAFAPSWYEPVLPGDHSDIGNDHDRGGFGDWNLRLAHQFMTKQLGLPLTAVPATYAPIPSYLWIHDMSGRKGVAPHWNVPFVRTLAPRYAPVQLQTMYVRD